MAYALLMFLLDADYFALYASADFRCYMPTRLPLLAAFYGAAPDVYASQPQRAYIIIFRC